MKNPILMLTACTFILGCGALAAYAQQGPETSMLQQAQKQSGDEEGADGPGMKRDDMMGHRMMRHDGMMGCDMMGRSRGVMGGPFAMRIIFALMDGDGDGAISLEEFQAAHARIFNQWMRTKMARSPWRRCRASCGEPEKGLPSARLGPS
jgi:hypothetical protein